MNQAISQLLNQFEQEAIRHAPIAIMVFDSENVLQIANLKTFDLMTGLSTESAGKELIGLSVSQLLPRLDLDATGDSLLELKIGDAESPFEIQVIKIEVDNLEWTAVYFQASSQRELLLEKEASTDELSGLANRRAFQRTVESNQHRALSLAIIDIDRFKAVNDDHGHLAGDDAIGLTSSLMTKCFADKSILLSRMGGDEFSVLFETSNARSIIESLDGFRQTVASSQLPELDDVKFSVSIGAVISTVSAIDSRTLLTHADQQLYIAKGKGRNQVAHVLLDGPGTT